MRYEYKMIERIEFAGLGYPVRSAPAEVLEAILNQYALDGWHLLPFRDDVLLLERWVNENEEPSAPRETEGSSPSEGSADGS